MKVWSPINIHAKSQVDRSTHNENHGEGSNELPPPSLRLHVLLKGLRLEGIEDCSKCVKFSLMFIRQFLETSYHSFQRVFKEDLQKISERFGRFWAPGRRRSFIPSFRGFQTDFAKMDLLLNSFPHVWDSKFSSSPILPRPLHHYLSSPSPPRPYHYNLPSPPPFQDLTTTPYPLSINRRVTYAMFFSLRILFPLYFPSSYL